MPRFHDIRFPNESDAYREARDQLLEAEMALRRQIEAVAVQRRQFPLGGRVGEDYAFTEVSAGAEVTTPLSALFGTHESLILYSFMYPPDGSACPMCTSLLDSLDGAARQVGARTAFAVIAKASAATLAAWAAERGWRDLRLLSSGATTYNSDYHAESSDGEQWSAFNVFRRSAGAIHHFWSSELFHAAAEPGQNPRHADMMWPLWNLLDLTPGGRGETWYPSLVVRAA